ncbi:hypothetical protein HMF8227_02032 [Saliniradius amylolyticus]|uniref:Outer membrane protein n=1 Tax=Saliniradius amylolyticus TaxID=2183582 RepID=A0A2S2E6A6_9ALTE|nr:TIGR04219 family outer membrane beta-barrel protein [Saliniradius amylolyticus]AWL12497.1 hypothetical protein HMF8227_02032 [Saliniradius amylolyticus]
MKRTLIYSALLAGLSIGSAQADTLFGVYAGAQGWNMETEGGFANDTDLTQFNFEDQSQSSFYVALEHPIPLVPNAKVRRTTMDTDGVVTLDSDFTFADTGFAAGTAVDSVLEMTATDYILYYEFFDNDILTFDFGLNGKHLDGNFVVVDETGTLEGRRSFSEVIPMLYSRVAAGMPLTGWGVEAEGSFLSIDDNTIIDAQAMVTYSLMDNIAVDLTFMAGYRTVTVELDDVDDLYTDLDFKGPYAGVEVHF